MRFAQILNGRAHWVFESEEKPEFAPDIVLVEVGPEVQEGWLWDGEVFSPAQSPSEPAEQTLEEVKIAKLAELAEARWREETGGLTLPDGTIIKTDRESQALLTGAALSATLDPGKDIEWKGVNGWVTLTSAQVLEIAAAVRAHVQSAFSREKALTEQVEACNEIAAVRAIVW
jgi:hypothetical protein